MAVEGQYIVGFAGLEGCKDLNLGRVVFEVGTCLLPTVFKLRERDWDRRGRFWCCGALRGFVTSETSMRRISADGVIEDQVR